LAESLTTATHTIRNQTGSHIVSMQNNLLQHLPTSSVCNILHVMHAL